MNKVMVAQSVFRLKLGGDESGARFKGTANYSNENEKANGSTWSESVINAGNHLTVKTGNDTNVIGGQLKGESVKMDVGNNLNVASLQNSDSFDYDKISASVSGTGELVDLALTFLVHKRE